MAISYKCEACGTEVTGEDMEAFGDAFIAHVRSDHPDWPYPDVAVRNFAEATQRLTGPSERLETLGAVEVHPVTEDRIDDWLSFFDHDGFVGFPAWAACYCTEPHLLDPEAEESPGRTWQQNREAMIGFLRSGRSFGYLAYVDGRPAGWVNASFRSEYALYKGAGFEAGGEVEDEKVVGISCFVIAPPYRQHGLAGVLTDRVLADAAGRGASWVEAYPFNTGASELGPDRDFRGPRGLYDKRGFEEVKVRERDTVVRRPVP